MNDRQPIAPGILRDLRNLDDSGPARSTEEFIRRKRQRDAQFNAKLDRAMGRLDEEDLFDGFPTAGDLKAEREVLERYEHYSPRQIVWEVFCNVVVIVVALYTVVSTIVGLAVTTTWIFGK